MSPPVVAGSDGPEPLLTSCVPLQDSRKRAGQPWAPRPEPLPFHSGCLCTRPFGKSGTHDLKFDGFAIQLDGSDLEVHPDGADVALCVCVILEQQGPVKWPEWTGWWPNQKTSLKFPLAKVLTAPNLPALCPCSLSYVAGRSCNFILSPPGLATTILWVAPSPSGHQPETQMDGMGGFLLTANRRSRHDLPTPESPIKSSLNR